MDNRVFTAGFISLGLLAGAGALAFVQPEPAHKDGGARVREGDDEGEQITLDKAPEAVRAAAGKVAVDAKNITRVMKQEEDGVIEYEVEFSEGGVKSSATFAESGELMATERGTSEAKLPAAVAAAIRKQFPESTVSSSSIVTEVFYEIEVLAGGKTHKVKISAAGDIDDEEKEHGDRSEKHEGKKGERDEEDDDEDEKE